MRYLITTILTLLGCNTNLSFGQAPAANTTMPQTDFCQSHPKDICCTQDTIGKPACIYATGGSSGPPGLITFTAGMSRTVVLDAIQSNPETGYKNLIEQNESGLSKQKKNDNLNEQDMLGP